MTWTRWYKGESEVNVSQNIRDYIDCSFWSTCVRCRWTCTSYTRFTGASDWPVVLPVTQVGRPGIQTPDTPVTGRLGLTTGQAFREIRASSRQDLAGRGSFVPRSYHGSCI